MLQYLVISVSALGLSLLITPSIRALALRQGVVRSRRWNETLPSPLPSLGGLAVALSISGAIGLGLLASGLFLYPTSQLLWGWRWFFVGALIILGVGVADDILDLRPLVKMGLQVPAALMVVAGDHSITEIVNPFTGDDVGLFWIGAPVTVLWVIGVTNAFNLIDGLDGLAAGVGLIAAVVLGIMGFMMAGADLSLMAAAIAGSLAGFLCYNFQPASVFLGDSGSLLLGYALSVLSLHAAKAGGQALLLPVPPLVLGLPVVDVLLAVMRRLLKEPNGRFKSQERTSFGTVLARLGSVLRPDQEHIHHRLVDAGLSPRSAVLILYAVCLAMGMLGLLAMNLRGVSSALLLGLVGLVALIGLRKLGYGRIFGRQ
jgi:UDP-GlcNAc:undecaprenyl-phosphate/decaprenyl-phosphate GlcNAc-1-phosphate transferase